MFHRLRTLPALLSGAVIALSLLAGCGPDPGTHTIRKLTDQEAILVTLEAWRSGVERGVVRDAIAPVVTDFLHQGRDRDDFTDWTAELAAFEDRRVTLSQVVIEVEADQARVHYLLSVEHCTLEPDCTGAEDPEACAASQELVCAPRYRCHSDHGARCGWLAHLRKEGASWYLCGDGRPWTLDFSIQATAAGMHLLGSVYDPERGLSAAAASFDGTADELALAQRSSDYWELPEATPIPPSLYPAHPLPWRVNVALTGATGVEDEHLDLASFLDTFATDLAPQGEAVVPFDMSWVSPADADAGARVEVLSGGAVIWQSGLTFAQRLTYSGPALTFGQTYTYRVLAFDARGASSVAEGAIIPLDPIDVSPVPQSVSPQTGSADGGDQLTISGSGFIAGARVLIGIAECLQVSWLDAGTLQCLTPALEPGAYNVLVVNPSGKSGMIERGFLVP